MQSASTKLWEFLPLIRTAADAVQGEDELPNFYDEVVAAAHELALQAGDGPEERGKRLIDAYVMGSGYGMGQPAMDLVKPFDLSPDQRSALAAYSRRRADGLSMHARRGLGDIALHLAGPVGDDGGRG